MADVALRGVTKQFGRTAVINGVDLHIQDGEFVVFVGPSGCGKSTLLRLLAGLESVSAGSVCIGGRDVTALPPKERGIAMVFQSYALYPHMNVHRNIAFGLHGSRLSKAEIDDKVRGVSEKLALTPLLSRLPRELSGGQRQRVAIGRAIVREPSVFLFDEPLSNLDATLRVQMRIEIARLHREMGTTMVYVTHDQVEAMTLADRIVVLNGGRIEQVGPPDVLYERPDNLFVAGFIGSLRMNCLPGQVEQVQADAVQVRLEGGDTVRLQRPGRAVQPASRVTVGIRPEHLSLQATPGACALGGTLEAVESLGDAHLLYLRRADGQMLCARQPTRPEAGVGQPMQLWLQADRCHLFDAAGQALGG